MGQTIRAIRGATTVDADDALLIRNAMGTLLDEMSKQNGFEPETLISLQLTQTPDLRSINAASALRSVRPEYGGVPLFCAQEPDIEGMLPRTIRVLATDKGEAKGKPVYLGAAAGLRPDLLSEE